MHRRRFLALSGSGLAVALAGCSEGGADESPGDDPETLVEAWYDAVEDGNTEEATALVHEDSLLQDDLEPLGSSVTGVEISITDTAAVSDGERRVTAELTLSYQDGSATGVVEHEVRTNEDGQWRLYDVRTVEPFEGGGESESTGPDETDPDSTESESTEQVSQNVDVLSAVGTVAADGDSVGEVRLAVAPAAGSGDVDLESVTIQYVSDDEFTTLVHVERAGSGDAAFDALAITAEDESNDVMSDSSDRYEVVVDLAADVAGDGDNSELDALSPGEEAELTITTAAGAQVVATVQAPNSLAGEEAGDTVTL